MTRYRVRVSEEAEPDLIDIYRYLAIHDSVEKAAQALCAQANATFRVVGK